MNSRAATGMYMNYFLLGMVNVILISNMGSLTEQWNTDSAGISYIIAAIGIGKLLTYAVAGRLSDRWGRKPLIVFASLVMGLFLFFIPMAPSYQIAFLLAFLAGVGNSAMDAGSYPGLIEVFPKSAGSASVMVKAFMATGTAALPIYDFIFRETGAVLWVCIFCTCRSLYPYNAVFTTGYLSESSHRPFRWNEVG